MYKGKSIFSGFIPTMQFIEKQHNLTLKALILSKLFYPLYHTYIFNNLNISTIIYMCMYKRHFSKDFDIGIVSEKYEFLYRLQNHSLPAWGTNHF